MATLTSWQRDLTLDVSADSFLSQSCPEEEEEEEEEEEVWKRGEKLV
jgi:hypothetical protein